MATTTVLAGTDTVKPVGGFGSPAVAATSVALMKARSSGARAVSADLPASAFAVSPNSTLKLSEAAPRGGRALSGSAGGTCCRSRFRRRAAAAAPPARPPSPSRRAAAAAAAVLLAEAAPPLLLPGDALGEAEEVVERMAAMAASSPPRVLPAVLMGSEAEKATAPVAPAPPVPPATST